MGVQNCIADLITDLVWKTGTMQLNTGSNNRLQQTPHGAVAECKWWHPSTAFPDRARWEWLAASVAISACAHVVRKGERAQSRGPEGKRDKLINTE